MRAALANPRIRLFLFSTVYAYLISLAVYFSLRGQGDLSIFLDAGSRFLDHKNPYTGMPMPFVHGPLSLPFYGLLSVLPALATSLIWNFSIVLQIGLLTFLIRKWYKIDQLFVLMILTLPTPFRTILGNGQVGLTVLLILVVLLNIDRLKNRIAGELVWLFGFCLILTVKPYLLLGLICKLIWERDFSRIFRSSVVFIIASLLIPFQNPLVFEFFKSLAARGRGASFERDNFSLAAAANVLNLGNFGLVYGLFLGFTLLFVVLRREQRFPHWLVLLFPLVISSYVHSQDLIQISLALILMLGVANLRVGSDKLQISVFILFCTSFTVLGIGIQFIIFSILVIASRKYYILLLALLTFVISIGSNHFLRSSDLTLAYHLYGINYQLILVVLPVIILFNFLYKIPKLDLRTNNREIL